MAVELKLIGFGDERPPAFGGKDRMQITISTPATPHDILSAAGIDDDIALVLMDQESVIPQQNWDDATIDDRQKLTLMSVIEGG